MVNYPWAFQTDKSGQREYFLSTCFISFLKTEVYSHHKSLGEEPILRKTETWRV